MTGLTIGPFWLEVWTISWFRSLQYPHHIAELPLKVARLLFCAGNHGWNCWCDSSDWSGSG